MTTTNNEFKPVSAFTHLAGCSLGTWTARETLYAMIRLLATAGGGPAAVIVPDLYKNLAEVSDEFLMETADDWQYEIADHLNAYMPMDEYCSVSLQDGEWVVLPHVDDELPRFDETPETFIDDCVLVVNDHGNTSLMAWDRNHNEYREVWAIV